MDRHILFIFEDDDYENFYPLTINRPVYLLRLGIRLLSEKLSSLFEGVEFRFCLRNELAAVTSLRSGVQCNLFSGLDEARSLFVNGRYLMDESLASKLMEADSPGVYLCSGNLVAAVLDSGSTETQNLEVMQYWGYGHFKEIIKSLPKTDVNVPELKYIWDFIPRNPMHLKSDFERIAPEVGKRRSPDAYVDPHCVIYGERDVVISDGCRIDANVVIDARGGPVLLDSNARIEPHTRIEGPCYVGKGSALVGGKIREGCSIGPVCKVGGEVEESIILGYSNKFHDGFLGHAYLGEWVNLGAGTTNSDLKNNYGKISVDLGYGQINTGEIKVGSFLGDHVKTGIGTMLNTGITIGFATNIFGAGLVADKFVPPFSWGSTGSYSEYNIEKAIETARVTSLRRGIEFTSADEKLFRHVHSSTSEQRKGLKT